MKKKRLLISFALTVFGLVTVGNIVVLPKASAAEQGTWLDSNSISYNGSEYLKSVKDAGTSYVKQGSSDLCHKSDQYASSDHDKYQGDLGKEIWVIRDIKDGNKKANHIKYKVVVYRGGSVVAPEEVEVNNGKLVNAYYGCQEINKFPIDLTEPQLKNADYRWINQEKIQDANNGKVYTRVNETTYEWKEDPGNCHEKIVVSADKKSGTLFHNGGEPTAAGGCSDSGYDKRNITIGRLELSDDPPGSNEELIGQHTSDDDTPESEPSCESEGGEMSWILCPILRYTSSFLQRVDEQLNHLLQVPNKYFEGDSAVKLKNSWGRLRDIAYIALIPIMLVMVIGTALGFELISAYTVKKALPRLVIAVIFMSLSFEICRFLIVLTNDVGRGLLGLLTSSFTGEQEITLAQLFDPGGGSGFVATFVLAGGGALALGAMGIVLSYGLVIGVTLLAAFLLLALRQMLLVSLIVLAPVAILSWIFPGNDKLWKLWWGSFSKLLLLYPLVMLLIGAGRAFAFIVQGAEDGGMLETILILTAYVGPYFFIPAMFKFAGGVFGNIAGMANDRSRGLLDRQKKYRERRFGEKYRDLKAGQYYNDRGMTSRFGNRLGARVGTGVKGRFGVGAGAQAVMDSNVDSSAAEFMKSDKFRAQSQNDHVLRAAASGRSVDESARNLQRIFGYSQAEAEQHAREAQATIGLGAMQQVAAAQQLVATGTGYASMEQMGQTLGLASGGNARTASRLAGFANSEAKRTGKHDLTPGFETLNNLVQAEASGARPTAADYDNAYGEAWASADPVSMVRDKSGSLETHLDRHVRNYHAAMSDHTAAVAVGDAGAQQDAINRAQRAEKAIYEMEANKSYADDVNAGHIDDAVQFIAPARQWLGGMTPTPAPGSRTPGTGRRVARRNAVDPNIIEWVEEFPEIPNYVETARAGARTHQQRDPNREDLNP